MKPTLRLRHSANRDPDNRSSRSPATMTSPAEGLSNPPNRLSSVVLPEPDGPMIAANSPRAMVKSMALRTAMLSLPRLYSLVTDRHDTMFSITASSHPWRRRHFRLSPPRASVKDPPRARKRVTLRAPPSWQRYSIFCVDGMVIADEQAARDHRAAT